jgi:hypothetical protein
MKRRPAVTLAGALAVVGMVVGPAVAPAGAGQRSGEQTFRVTIYEVYPNGHSEGTGPIRGDGIFDGKGVNQEVASAASDPANSNRGVSTFAAGSLTVLSTGGNGGAPKVDEDCNFTFTIDGAHSDIVSGTGAFAHATGHFTTDLRIEGALPHNPDGSCNQSQNANPLFDTVHAVATGHLKL